MASYWVDCGLFGYKQAHELQTQLVEQCRQTEDEYYLFLEHPPVFTLGKRGGRAHLGVSEQFLQDRGIDLVHIERGGDITYHGPGQIIVYPIFHLRRKKIAVTEYVKLLEEIMLRTAAEAGIQAGRDAKNHGIWVGQKKLGSIGIAIRHGVTFHGLGLNVSTNLTHFDWINPCGLTQVKMTSFAGETGATVDLAQVKENIRHHFCRLLAPNLQQVPLQDIENIPCRKTKIIK